MFDAKRLLDQLVGSGVAGGFAGGLAGGALGSMLAGKRGKKLAGNALKLGGLALVGGLAYKAWQSYQQGASLSGAGGIEVPPAGSAFLPDSSDAQATGSLGLLLARAMIAAARLGISSGRPYSSNRNALSSAAISRLLIWFSMAWLSCISI